MLNDPNGDENDYRPLGEYGDLNVFRHSLDSHYQAPGAAGAPEGAIQLHAGLHVLEGTGYRGIEGGLGLSEYIHLPYRDYNYGVLHYDRTQVATASFSWLLPEPSRDSGAMYHVLGGWQLAGIVSYGRRGPAAVHRNREQLRPDRYRRGGRHPRRAEHHGLSAELVRSRCSPAIRPRMFPAATLSTRLLRRSDARQQRQLQHALHEGADLLEHRTCRSTRTSTWAATRGCSFERTRTTCSTTRSPIPTEHQPDPALRRRRPERPGLRPAAGEQQVRTAHRPTRGEVHLLGQAPAD